MTARIASLSLPRAAAGRDVAVITGVALTAALAGYQLAQGSRMSAVALCLLPLVAILLARPTVPLVLLGASLPFLHSFTVAGYLATVSDLLLVLVFAGILLQSLISGSWTSVRALRPVAAPLLVYSAVMVVLLPAHLSLSVIVQTGQRFQLFLFPLVVGAFAALTGRITPMLQAYVVSATLLAVAWPLDLLTGQKNPVGQLIGNAILLLVGVRSLHRLLPLLVVLVPGLLVTQSRGAILATIVGVVALMAMQGLGTRRMITRVAALAMIAAVAFALLPGATRERITTLSAGTESNAAYAIQYRQQFATDAWQIIHADPWTGIGVGNYLAGDAYDYTSVTDPHQVLLLQAAEGGYVLAASFVLLIAGSVFVLYRMRRVELAPVAAGILVATAAHGLVDVYWVRVTPVLGWLLVGMVCGLHAKSRESEAPA